MCGFAGFRGAPGRSRNLEQRVAEMAGKLVHRGPDDQGIWCEPEAGLAFGFRRLAILDLSPQGRQPMESASGRFVVMMNGEIYNHQELREATLAGGFDAGFRGSSDTEVLLAAIETFGLTKALQRARGMFAIALWDRRERTLQLARDRFGEKPLYYGWQGGDFLFGSELKALRVHPSFKADIDPNVLSLYLRHGYVPAPYTIYQGLFKLSQGCILTVPESATGFSPWDAPQPYWSLHDVVEARQVYEGSEEEAAGDLEKLLLNTVGQQMIADVPLGAFLSGGLDSSLIVSLMQANASRPVKTFTIGFQEAQFDESPHARAVAKHLGTDHTELIVTPQDTLDAVPLLPSMYDEPFADSSQVPTYLVSKLAREHVTVSLSGDGGDEMFGGYNRYQWAEQVWSRVSIVPGVARGPLASAMRALSPEGWDRVIQGMGRAVPAPMRCHAAGDKIHKLSHVVESGNFDQLYLNLVSQWKNPTGVVPGSKEPRTQVTSADWWPGIPSRMERMMYVDAMSYMPDDVLVKVDRATMAVSLESRAPFLDHRVAEFAWNLPPEMKATPSSTKRILKRVLANYVPAEITDRPKMGFGVPIGSWLRGPLRGWAEELLQPSEMPYFESAQVHKTWEEHQSGRRNRSPQLWAVLMFQAWLKETAAS